MFKEEDTGMFQFPVPLYLFFNIGGSSVYERGPRETYAHWQSRHRRGYLTSSKCILIFVLYLLTFFHLYSVVLYFASWYWFWFCRVLLIINLTLVFTWQLWKQVQSCVFCLLASRHDSRKRLVGNGGWGRKMQVRPPSCLRSCLVERSGKHK